MKLCDLSVAVGRSSNRKIAGYLSVCIAAVLRVAVGWVFVAAVIVLLCCSFDFPWIVDR